MQTAAVGDDLIYVDSNAGFLEATAGQQTHLKGNVTSSNLKITNTNGLGSAAAFFVEDIASRSVG